MVMKLKVPQVKKFVVPIRLSQDLFNQTRKIAESNKTKHSTILRILIEKALNENN